MTTATDERLAYRVPEAAALAGISTDAVRAAIRAGHLRAMRPAGTKQLVLIDAAEFRRWLSGVVTPPDGPEPAA